MSEQQQQQQPTTSAEKADSSSFVQCLNELTENELVTVLDAVNHNTCGRKTTLYKRVLNLAKFSSKSTLVKYCIAMTFESRHSSAVNSQSSNNLLCFNDSVVPYIESPLSPQPLPNTESLEYFEDLVFFNPIKTLLFSDDCEYQCNDQLIDFSGNFYITKRNRNFILNSWIINKTDNKIQIILKLKQIESENNTCKYKQLPKHLTVFVNDHQCKLPTLMGGNKFDFLHQYNTPINITQETDLNKELGSSNKLKIRWPGEQCNYKFAVFLVERLSWLEVLVDLRKRPLLNSEETKLLIKISLENDDDDNDMAVDSMFATLKDPLNKTRMEWPVRSKDCKHFQCFDAIPFLQMNEQKQTWLCPICNEKLNFENLRIDEFFLNVLKSPDLNEESEKIILFKDGSWAVEKLASHSNISELQSNDNQTNNDVEIVTLTDSDDDDNFLLAKRLKPNSLNSNKNQTNKHIEVITLSDSDDDSDCVVLP